MEVAESKQPRAGKQMIHCEKSQSAARVAAEGHWLETCEISRAFEGRIEEHLDL